MTLVKKINAIIKHPFSNVNILISTIFSSVFLGLSKNEDDVIRALFLIPCTTYLYSYIIIRKPLVLLIYLLSYYITKKINERNDRRGYES